MQRVSTVGVAFNGPPGIGKDTLVGLINQIVGKPIRTGTLANMIREDAAKYYGIKNFFELSTGRETKDVKCPGFNMTPRQMLIDYSENVIKKNHGKDYFAKKFAEKMSRHKQFMMTDLGFVEEAEALADRVDLLIIVQLEHPDFDFSRDSRGYVKLHRSNVFNLPFVVSRGDAKSDARRILAAIQHACEEKLGL
ncbi:deoxynucleoside monophosphate kinase [Aeromonas phage ZPAH14]|uniref:Uncharacterized protein n=1 Tax=Aeromonas phage ZPAH14 TaxID=2924887 RepID=A0AAE9GW28_9CAUD|nr:deoxynucleoside monophosphate kinase [Aeromonas phage ZPAH14]UOT58029.1 hypothetical protein [Aeromonas phage ZPAH14]